MSDKFIATCKVANHTAQPLRLIGETLSYGHWLKEPLKTVPPHQTLIVCVSQGTSWTATGTQGSVVFDVGTLSTVTLCFDDPYIGSNNTKGTGSNNGIFNVASSVPSSGKNVEFDFTITKAGV